jgi:hypothetical protein
VRACGSDAFLRKGMKNKTETEKKKKRKKRSSRSVLTFIPSACTCEILIAISAYCACDISTIMQNSFLFNLQLKAGRPSYLEAVARSRIIALSQSRSYLSVQRPFVARLSRVPSVLLWLSLFGAHLSKNANRANAFLVWTHSGPPHELGQ